METCKRLKVDHEETQYGGSVVEVVQELLDWLETHDYVHKEYPQTAQRLALVLTRYVWVPPHLQNALMDKALQMLDHPMETVRLAALKVARFGHSKNLFVAQRLFEVAGFELR
jgi:hypothetical protein